MPIPDAPLSYRLLLPEHGQKPTSAVLLLHGVGADSNDLISLGQEWRETLPRTVFISPDAPQPFDMAPFGRQWFSLQEFTLPAIANGLKTVAAPALAALVAWMKDEYELADNALALVGFSQGAITALYSVYRQHLPCAGVVAMAGLLSGDAPLEAGVYPPALLIHGTDDTVVPPIGSQSALAKLEQAGVNSELLLVPGLAHGIEQQGLAQAGRFLRTVLP
jgi:phospholipase/carboxylesterase